MFLNCCSSSEVGIDDSPNPYYANITNTFFNKNNVKFLKFKLYEEGKEDQNKNLFYVDLIQSIKTPSEDGTITVSLMEGQSNTFFIQFLPYGMSSSGENKEIGKPLHFIYEVYKEDKLFIKKNITIKGEYIKPKGTPYRNWLLKTDKFDIQDRKYVEKVDKENRMFVLKL